MPDLLSIAAVLVALVVTAKAFAMYGDARTAAKAALRDALERGDIRAEEYAAHLRALDEAA